MAQNKLISILSTLSNTEWKETRQYILQNTSKSSDLFKLFEYIYKKYKHQIFKWDTEVAHQNLLPSISRKTFLNMMSTLSKWVESSLVIQLSLKDDINKQLLLLKVYTNRGLYQLADQQMVKTEKSLKKLDHKDLDYRNYLKELLHITYFSNNPIKYKNGTELLLRLTAAHLNSTTEYDYFYMAELLNWGRLRNDDFSEEIDLLKTRVGTHQLEGEHYFPLLIKMMAEDDYESFLALKEKVLTGEWDHQSEVHITITHYLTAWVMKFWHQGVLEDIRMITELYDYGLRTKALLVEDRVPEKRFHNIISTIGALSENGWSLQFIEEWGDRVNSKDPSQNKSLGKAQFLFYKKKYAEITPLLRSLKFESDGQQVRLMGLQLAAWYEDRAASPDQFAQFSTNFKRFLKRHRSSLSPHYHDSHVNLIKILEGLFKGQDKLALKDFLDSANRIIYRKYLNEKFE